jgi:hypothetical protein
MLIRAFGTFWNPEIVDWGSLGRGNQGRLLGKVPIDGKTHTVDFWEGKGIYVLHDNFDTVYIGKAFGTELGPRLRNHLSDRLTGRWDMFSWYTLSTVNKTSSDLRAPGKRQLAPETVNDTLEALAISISDPPLNRRHESIPEAYEVEQVEEEDPTAIKDYLEEIIDKLE